MKQELLVLQNADELKVDGRKVTDFDVQYNFSAGALVHKPRDGKRKISTYIISKELVNAVNAAIVTGRPLLLKGEPGCGKTKLAQAVASYFFKEDAYKYYFEWHVKSKSRAREGGYEFDHVGRLRDATISVHDETAKVRAANPDHYISLGAMGKTFTSASPLGTKPIMLIDEIDKGDIDFPNDLLLELDEMRFKIIEKVDTYIEAPKDLRPLVFITSNNERELPPAFLRRCLYYYIPAFDKDLMVKIATSKMGEFYDELNAEERTDLSGKPIEDFVDKFMQLKDNAPGSKPPSTSEMLDWLKLLTFRVVHEGSEFADLIQDKDLQQIALKLNA